MKVPVARESNCPLCDAVCDTLDVVLRTPANLKDQDAIEHVFKAVGSWWVANVLGHFDGDVGPLLKGLRNLLATHGIDSEIASEPARRPQAPPSAWRSAFAIDHDGRSLPFAPAQVDGILARAMAEGKLLAVVLQMPNGEVAVPVIGDPSKELCAVLRAAATSYEKAIRGH